MDQIRIHRLLFLSIYKVSFIGVIGFFIPFSLLQILFVACGVVDSIYPHLGLRALVIAPTTCLATGFISALGVGTILNIGLWLYSLVGPLRL